MIKKTINYTDFNGEQQVEDFYFNLSKAEVTEMEMTTDGGLSEHIQKIVKAKNNKELITLFKELIIKSVGSRSANGSRFIKNDTIREEFTSSEAYSVLFMELATSDNAAVEFVKGIMPADLLRDHA